MVITFDYNVSKNMYPKIFFLNYKYIFKHIQTNITEDICLKYYAIIFSYVYIYIVFK